MILTEPVFHPVKIKNSGSPDNAAFIPKEAKSKDTDKLAAYYRFTTTHLDLDASTLKEAISKQNYAKDECIVNRTDGFYRDSCSKADKKRPERAS